MLYIACLIGSALLPVSMGHFVVSRIFQLLGHKIEGKKPSFLEDLQYLLIVPVFVLSKLFIELGIKWESFEFCAYSRTAPKQTVQIFDIKYIANFLYCTKALRLLYCKNGQNTPFWPPAGPMECRDLNISGGFRSARFRLLSL